MASDVRSAITLILGVSGFLLFMFLPALIELKKPKDAGPRRILPEDSGMKLMGLFSLDVPEVGVDKILLSRVSEVTACLSCLET